MGTNFYLVSDETVPRVCPECGVAHPTERVHVECIHIGKSSAGWCFSLHVAKKYDSGFVEDLPHNLEGWKAKWQTPGYHIEDEYGKQLTPEEMLQCITGEGTWDLLVGDFS